MTPPILVVGSLAYDDIRTPRGRRTEVLGGGACYFALAASHYAPVRLVGVVGDDFRAEDVARLARRGVDLRGLERRQGRSLRWLGRYAGDDLGAAETLNTDLGVSAGWRPAVPAELRETPFVFLANAHPAAQLAVLDQIARPRIAVMDSMHHWLEYERAGAAGVMARVNVVSLNEAEALAFARTSDLGDAAREILALGPRAVVVKRGAHGSLLRTHESSFWVPAFPVERIQDPTGAGDAFAGGFLGHLAQVGDDADAELWRALLHGTVAASFAVERFGVEGVEAMTRASILERYRRLRELVATEPAAVPEREPSAG
ncbi:MAG TPA: PfkB family carbohydrate kinase [Candidatus Limnocylindrales bacterium]|nr:PfkB family carbohydrate kinase [Candidatus Limnocylindrales bacterium]